MDLEEALDVAATGAIQPTIEIQPLAVVNATPLRGLDGALGEQPVAGPAAAK